MIGKRKRRTEIDGLFDHLAFIYSEKGSHLAQKKLPHDKHDKKSIQVKHSEDMRWSLYNKLHNDKQIVQKSQQRDNDQVHQRTKKNEEGTTSHERVNDIEDVPDIGFKHKKIHHKMVNKKTAKKKTTIQAGRPRNMLPIAASNESHFHDPNQESEESSENIKGHQLNEDSQQNFSKVKTYKKQKFKQTTNTTNEILERKMENKENDKVCSEQIQSKLRQDEVGNYCSNLQKNLFKSSLNEALPNEVTHLDVKVDFSINDKCNFFYDKLKINEFGHQENTNVQHKHSHKKRKGQYKDGIKLDLTLLSQKTPKRACSIKNTLSNNSNPAVGSTAGTCKSQPNIKDREHIFLKDKSSNIKRNTIDVSYHENKIKIGDLVTGKLRGYDWWFGMVVSHRTARQRPAAKDCYWIRWFGDHKISEVHVQNIESLKSFSTRYLPSKMQGLYLRSVKELLDEAAKRCSKTDLPEDSSKRLDVLIDWAKSGFQPFGVELLAQCSEGHKT